MQNAGRRKCIVSREHCQPFADAMKEKAGQTAKKETVPTLAEEIAIGVPMRDISITARSMGGHVMCLFPCAVPV